MALERYVDGRSSRQASSLYVGVLSTPIAGDIERKRGMHLQSSLAQKIHRPRNNERFLSV